MANTHSLNLELSSSQYAIAPDNESISGFSDVTMEAWIKIESLPGSDQMIVAKYDYVNNKREYIFFIEGGTNKLKFHYSHIGTSGGTQLRGSTALQTGQWYHVAAAIDVSAADGTFYLNGVAETTTRVATVSSYILNDASYFGIGAIIDMDGNPLGGYFDGLIDDLRIWESIRSQSEIQNNMSKEILGNEPGLVGYWKFNNNLNDTHTNATTLTATNSPTFSTDTPFIDSPSPSISPSASVSPSISPSASISPSSSDSASISPSSSVSPSISPSSSISPSVPDITEGSTTWGHETGVTETNTRTFTDNWTGTGTITGSGDSEIVELNAGEYMESEIVSTGASATVTLLQNTYNTGDDVTIKYRHGDSEANCEAAEYQVYSTPFSSAGYVQIRLESTL